MPKFKFPFAVNIAEGNAKLFKYEILSALIGTHCLHYGCSQWSANNRLQSERQMGTSIYIATTELHKDMKEI
jgi:hypothetical protein